MHGGTLSLVSWSDAAYGDLSQNGKCRPGYLIGITPSSLSGPRNVLQRASKFTRRLVKSSLGGEVYSFSKMIDHMALSRGFYAPFSRISPSMVGMEDCESLFTHLENREMVTEKYLVRHFLSIQQFIEEGEQENAHRLPGVENPADGLTKIKSEMGPILSLLETGRFQPGLLRPL